MLENFVSSEQLRLMPLRVLYAQQTEATKTLSNILWECEKENCNSNQMKILVVGAGGSYPSALFAKQVLSKHLRTSNIDVATPQTAVKMLNQFSNISGCKYKPFYDIVIGISYSGKTPDIRCVYEICKEREMKFVLVTKAKKEDMEQFYEYSKNDIVSYFNPNDDTKNERGMISMASTYAPLAIFNDLFGESRADNQNLFNSALDKVKEFNVISIAKTLKNAPVINVFYEYSTMPTAFDIESKFTKAGIANVILHEKKNFSHGRYVALYKLKAGLNINLTYENVCWDISKGNIENITKTNYDKLLKQFLKEVSTQKGIPYIEIGTSPINDYQWNIEAMAIIPYLLVGIGNASQIDVSKPLNPFPDEPKSLYGYEGKI